MPMPDLVTSTFVHYLKQNPYPGRGLVVGVASDGEAWIMVYWIMGRSAQSRNRRFVVDGQGLRTEPIAASEVLDPSLIIYEAMLEAPPLYVIGNGAQVRTLYDRLRAGGSFDSALAEWEREPDAPHYTPRISAVLDLQQAPGHLTLSVLKANPVNPVYTDRFTYRPANPPPGLGIGLTTYLGDGSPLPSFTGDPLWLPCAGTPHEILETYWEALDADNRVALAVKHIPHRGCAGRLLVRNRVEA